MSNPISLKDKNLYTLDTNAGDPYDPRMNPRNFRFDLFYFIGMKPIKIAFD